MEVNSFNFQRVQLLQSRRSFLQKGLFGGSVLVFAGGELFGAVSTMETMKVLQEDLFVDTPNTPTMTQINALAYLAQILSHPRVPDAHKLFLRNGIQWLNEEALVIYKKSYIQLPKPQREQVLQSIAKSGWGESFIHRVFGYIFEAMLGDPVYGINKHEVGWKWLGHIPGLPRPKESLV